MIPIYVAFLLLSAILLWFIIGASGKWPLKLALIVIVPVFMFMVWKSLATFTGWSTTQAPPKASLYVYGYAIEPDPMTHVKGAIYVWLIPGSTPHGVFDYKSKLGEPRSYKLPYSRKLEQEIQGANSATGHGQAVGFGKTSGTGKKKKKQAGRAGNRNDGGTYTIYPLPTIGPPRKGSNP